MADEVADGMAEAALDDGGAGRADGAGVAAGAIAERAVRMRRASSSRARSVAASLRPRNTVDDAGFGARAARSAASCASNMRYIPAQNSATRSAPTMADHGVLRAAGAAAGDDSRGT